MSRPAPTGRPAPDLVKTLPHGLLIGGELVDAAEAATFETINPSTGEKLSAVPLATATDVDRAVEAAGRAQPGWEQLGLRGRRPYLERLADAVEDRLAELAMLDALDGGNPITSMRRDVAFAVQHARDWPGLALGLQGRALRGRGLHYTLHQPYGVVGRIIPFNHPALFAVKAVLAPLVAGNTVILKPAEQTPLSALLLAGILSEVLPPGVVNILTGGPDTGDALVAHPEVKRIAFTGSVATGMRIQRRAAEATVKHVTLELGGKNAMIVFPDADVDEVVEAATKGMNFEHCQGQSCGATSRIFVPGPLHDEFVDRFVRRVGELRLGPAHLEDTEMGPLITEQHRQRVMDHIERGRREGAEVVCGGGPPPGTSDGWFLAPTVLVDVTSTQALAQDEIFGPVAAVFRWDDYDEMLRQVNGVPYGLTASIWTDDLHAAHRTAELVEAGYVWINDVSTHYWGTPFGGVKSSGVGREESMEELESYCELKAVHTVLRPRVDLPR